jgi:hypothetical protein
MKESKVHFIWQGRTALRHFSTGVSLHGHTMHSQECLSFLPRYLHQAPGISQIVRGYEQPRRGGHAPVDFARAYWTPPLSPASAFQVERAQIEALELLPHVSLTDHDDIEACLSLQVAHRRTNAPVSVEWTVPYGRTIFHLGIHNLPDGAERRWMAAMAAFTAAPNDEALPELLRALAGLPETLIVLNHPFWLEEGVVEAEHRIALPRLLRECGEWLHAFELNGTRPWAENAETIALAAGRGRPVISGGDRHACEPGANLNLTNAQSFAEFASEIRRGESTVMFMPQYREPMALRILQTARDILRPYPEYPGRERWSDRIFYRGEDGVARPLSANWGNRAPFMLDSATGVIQMLASSPFCSALRRLLMQRGEALS